MIHTDSLPAKKMKRIWQIKTITKEIWMTVDSQNGLPSGLLILPMFIKTENSREPSKIRMKMNETER